MENLEQISAGQKGSVVAESINTNMMKIHDAISELEDKIRRMSISQSGGTVIEEDLSLAGVVIVASPESTLAQTLSTEQVFEIPISVYCGNKQLRYDGLDDGYNSYAIDLGNTNIQDKNGITIATVSIAVRDSQIILKMSIKPNVVANFKYEFGVIFRNVRYKKVLGFTVIMGDGENAMSVDLSPTTVIVNEAYSGGTFSLKDALANYSVQLGSLDVTDITQCEVISAVNCDYYLDTDKKTIQITDIKRTTLDPSATNDMCETFEWTDLDGTQHSVRKPVAGNVKLLFSHTNSSNVLYQVVKTFSFAVNYLGTFKESITNDIHMQVSEKLRTELSDEGLLLTEANKTTIIQDAERVAISAATLSSSGAYQTYLEITSEQISSLISDVEGNMSQLQQTAELLQSTISDVSGNTSSIRQSAEDISLIINGLTQTGIDINGGSGGTITLSANTVNFVDTSGNTMAIFNETGGLTTEMIDASHIVAKKIEVYTPNERGGYRRGVFMNEDGSLSAYSATFYDVIVQGSIQQPFIEHGAFIDGETHSDNFNVDERSFNTDNGYYPDNCLTWDMRQSGNKIVINMLTYGDMLSVADGTATLNAPEGKNVWFYEDGYRKKSLNLSREYVELIGIATTTKFLGYMVLKRGDTLTVSRYGHHMKFLCQGVVSYSPSAAEPSRRCYTFDDTKNSFTVSAVPGKTGCTKLSWSNYWFSDAAYVGVMVTGLGGISEGNPYPIAASVYERDRNYACVMTVNPITNSAINAPYEFLVYNMGDWCTLNGTVTGNPF